MSIVADTSAFIAILQKETEAKTYRSVLLEVEKVLISTATALELHIVVTAKLDADGILRLNHLLAQPLFEIVPVDQKQMNLANQAYERYGKGRHPAKSRNLPLLFKGNDFSRTDLVSCLSVC